MSNTTRELFEQIDGLPQTVRVDREAGVIRGVRIINAGTSRNSPAALGSDLAAAKSYGYSPAALKAARQLYEGKSVNLGHRRRQAGKAPEERPLAERFGRLADVRETQEGHLDGDLHYIKSHPLAGMIVEMAERMPDQLGLSQHAFGRPVKHGDAVLIKEITRVESVDLVSDPATTRSLFESYMGESMDGEQMTAPGATETAGSGDMTWDTFVAKAKEIYDGQGEAKDKAAKIGKLAKTLFGLADKIDQAINGGGGGDNAGGDATAQTTESKRPEQAAADPAVRELQEKLARMEAKESARGLFESAGVAAHPTWVDACAALPADQRQAYVDSLPKGGGAGATVPRSSAPRQLTESKQGEQLAVDTSDRKAVAGFLRGR